MSLRLRFAVLASAGLLAAGYTAALAFEPLCAVFRSMRHYSTRSAERAAPATTKGGVTPTAAAHR
jgi:hypothetical protein